MQCKVYTAVVRDGQSVFVSGCGGTGKSYLVEKIREVMPSYGVHVTASTGIAGVNVGGTTLHSFSGLGLGNGPFQKLIHKMSPRAKKRWKNARILFIDEISMISAEFWDKVEQTARYMRKTDLPFGGLQLIVTGDFLQLPPVIRNAVPGTKRFAFEADSWSTCFGRNEYELTHVFRQSDRDFVDILQDVRHGLPTERAIKALTARVDADLDCSDGIEPTQLLARRADVNRINGVRLSRLGGDAHTYMCADSGEARWKETLAKNTQASAQLMLRVGAQVMLLKNLDPEMGLVNGSRGVVEGFAPAPPGAVQAYAESADKGPRFAKAAVHSSTLYPRVRFCNGVTMVVTPERWNIEQDGNIKASRDQVPLILAWAVTIHRSQGMTLDRAIVSLAGVFECGQAYVALSRMRDLSGLRIVGFSPACIMADPAALAYYKKTQTG
jgi:ATP-dependent DNA helicase PIF1